MKRKVWSVFLNVLLPGLGHLREGHKNGALYAAGYLLARYYEATHDVAWPFPKTFLSMSGFAVVLSLFLVVWTVYELIQYEFKEPVTQ